MENTIFGGQCNKCYITLALSGSPNTGKQNQKTLPHPYLLGGPKEGGSAMSPPRSRVSPNKGTKSKVAHKWAEVVLLFLEVLKPSKKNFLTRF